MPVGLAGQVLDPRAADRCSGLLQVFGWPVGTEDMNRLPQRLVGQIEIAVVKRRRLVHHLMRGIAMCVLGRL